MVRVDTILIKEIESLYYSIYKKNQSWICQHFVAVSKEYLIKTLKNRIRINHYFKLKSENNISLICNSNYEKKMF